MERLRGKRKQRRDEHIRRYEHEHPQQTEREIGEAFGISQSVVSRALKVKEEENENRQSV